MRGLKNNISLVSVSVKTSLTIPTCNYMSDLFTTWGMAIMMILLITWCRPWRNVIQRYLFFGSVEAYRLQRNRKFEEVRLLLLSFECHHILKLILYNARILW